MSMQQVFEKIYADNVWGGGSGEGSRLVHTRGYAAFIQRFLRGHAIRSVVDFGCGDWQFSRTIDWAGVTYDGFDLVPGLIDHHNREFGSPTIRFHVSTGHMDPTSGGDLLIIKDVMQHWSEARIRAFLPRLNQFKHALITNCVNPAGPTVNRDIADGDFRYLDLNGPPFSLGLPLAYRFTNFRGRFLWWARKPQFVKHVLHHARPD